MSNQDQNPYKLISEQIMLMMAAVLLGIALLLTCSSDKSSQEFCEEITDGKRQYERCLEIEAKDAEKADNPAPFKGV